MAAATPKSARGLLKLCPPGGESFANAWQITCGMKRRKKREAEMPGNSTGGWLLGDLIGRAFWEMRKEMGLFHFYPGQLISQPCSRPDSIRIG